jgi:hypothetical protein
MKLLLFGAMASLLLPDVSTAQTRSSNARRVETYQSVAIDAAGGLVITTSDRKTILVPRETDQSSFSEPIVSSARTAVGAQAEFPNCCTSYDIPLQLVIYANGKVHRFTGSAFRFSNGTSRMPEPAWLSARSRSTSAVRCTTSSETFSRSDSLTRPTFLSLADKSPSPER